MIQPFFSTPILDIVVDEELETRDVHSNEVHIMSYAAGSNHSSWGRDDVLEMDAQVCIPLLNYFNAS